MQTVYLDISNKGVVPTIYAKQGDVGKKFVAVLTDAGVPYTPKAGTLFSVWYDGPGGTGNYSKIGENNAVSISGNKATIELIAQMLVNSGDGEMALVATSANGEQLGFWNMRYDVEAVPGADSEAATEYYTALGEFAKATQDALSLVRVAVDATKKHYVMLGDSNAAGLGWYRAKGLENKTDETDGVFAVLREMLPNATFTNFSVASAGFVRGVTIQQQISQLEQCGETPDVIFVWAGGNDITHYIGGDKDVVVNVPDMNSFDQSTFDDSLFGRVDNSLYTLRSRYPFAKICGVIRTFKFDQRKDVQAAIYGTIAKIYNKYQCSVINLNDYSNIVKQISEQAEYWYDDGHYSEKAFRDLLAPIFYSAIMDNLNINTNIPNFHSAVSHEVKTGTVEGAQTVLASAFANGLTRAGSVIVQNFPSYEYALLVGGKLGTREAVALRLFPTSDEVQYIRKNGDDESTAWINFTHELLEGCDFEKLQDGKYIASKAVSTGMTNMPPSFDTVNGVGFIADIQISKSTGARYAQIMEFDGKFYLGSRKTGETYRWKIVSTANDA